MAFESGKALIVARLQYNALARGLASSKAAAAIEGIMFHKN